MKYIGNLLLGLGFGGALAAFAVGCGGEGDTSVFGSGSGSTSGGGGNGGMSSTGSSGTGGASGCVTNADCDDGFPCTIDACNGGACAHVVGPNSGPTACPQGTLCELGKGCTQVIVCATDDQCIQQLGTDACKVNIHCDGATSTCTYDMLDKDNDGHAPIVCGGGDCNDADPDVFPGAPEVCDGKDNACNGSIDNGATCPGMGVCQNGSCSCAPDNTCGTACVDKSTDPNNCGMCNNVCPGAASCVNGQCSCPMGSTVCGGVCVDTKADAQNCGGCGKTCAPGYACANGFCTCLGTPCGAQCIDTSSDPLNCGGCNVVCPAGTACQNGSCSCSAPFALCNGQCVDTNTNPSHCGGCNKPCTGACQNGVCQQCTVANLHVLFDISGSMGDAAIGGTRLEIARTGVNAFMNDALSSNMGLGLGYHPVAGSAKTCLGTGTPCMVDADCGGIPFPLCQAGGDSCTASDYATPAVGIALLPGVKTPISNSLAAQMPTGASTPPPGLQGALQYAKAYAMSHAGQKVGVVLMADDMPNTCTNNSDQPTDLIPIAQQYASGSPKVVTYVIGIGTGASPDPTQVQWNQIAAAGGTGTAYVANSAIEVQSALAAIRSQFKTCP